MAPACECTSFVAAEIQCNGADDDCDGVTDPTSATCGGTCVNLATNAAHCGACGAACRATEVCVAGRCQCPGVRGEFCMRAMGCRDLATDPANCGGCGLSCSGTFPNGRPGCTNGLCGMACNTGFADCDGTIANGCETSTTTALNCGACGRTCTGGSCSTGTCVCPTGQTLCGGACVNLQTSSTHCGACGRACSGTFANASPTCVAGACVGFACNAGFGDCDGMAANGCETNLNTVSDCGACGRRCGGTCSGGVCTCPAGLSQCGFGVCVNNRIDPRHCSRCGRDLASNQWCMDANPVCVSGQFCAGVCTSPEDPRNCGRCGNVCASGQFCIGGICGAACTAPRVICTAASGTRQCVDLQTSRENCGSCGASCGAHQECAGGACRCAGTALTLCSSACVDLTLDRMNCGRCGNVCPNNTNCVSGMCR